MGPSSRGVRHAGTGTGDPDVGGRVGRCVRILAPMGRARSGVVGAVAAATLLGGLLVACSHPTPAQTAACTVASLPGLDGTLFGVNLDWDDQTVQQYADLLGHRPADVVSFAPVPWTDEERNWVLQAAQQAAGTGSVQLLTLEPQDGLAAVTDDVVADVVAVLKQVNDLGVPVILRFAHEMNGSWYAWGQQPLAYVATFRRVADAVHQEVPGAAMMWAPNYGGGYPFAGGQYQAQAGSADAAALDTDGDGQVTAADDPYAPYYPGDEYVDWVGMSLYHWGSAYPWGENELPEDGKFAAQLTGTYDGLGGDETAVPDFYDEYGAQRGKPVAIPETAALVVPRGADAAERAIQQAWWRQVFSPDTHERFPQLRLVNWFEWVKLEDEVGETVHWAVLPDETTRAAFRADLPGWLRYADAVRCVSR